MRHTNGLAQRPCASLLACFVAFAAILSAPVLRSPLHAQEGLDPSEIWYRGFLLVQAAQDLESKGKMLDALNKLSEAKPLYDHLAQQFPDFQPEIVRERRHLIAEKRDELKAGMRPNPAAPASAPAAAPTPGSALLQNAGEPPRALAIAPPPLPGSEFAESPGDMGGAPRGSNFEIAEENGEVALPTWSEGASQALPRADAAPIPGMPRVENRSAAVGAIANSLQSDLSSKDALISWLNDENQKLRNELKQREQLLQHVNNELFRARASREELMHRIAAAEAGGGGVEAQQKIEQLKTLLRDATTQLDAATERNEQLVAAMEQSQQEMQKMRTRMGELERERDNLLEVVQGGGNGGKALKELMDRNRVLAEQLDRAEQLAASLSELNKEKDDDIALLKTEITRIKLERDQLLTENERHQQSIEDLQKKLEALSDGLSAEDKQALANASPVERQENELLRSMVLKQLRRQAQMKQAKELLLSQLDRLGARSDVLLGLIEDMARGSKLSDEEKALFKTPQFEEIIAAAAETGEVTTEEAAAASETATAEGNEGEGAVMTATLVAAGKAPEGVSPDGVIEKQKLTVELAQIDKAARLDFKEGRYAEAEAGFLEYLRYLPQNVPCLCNLGVLKISMKNYSEAEYFLEKAIAIDGKSGLAFYLLGRTYFLQDKLDEALEKLETGLTFDPQNAKAHNCVGVISTRKGWVDRAQRAFVNAVSIDPDFGDAHFNLAVLFATKEQPDPAEAGKHYFRALHLGIPRDATIEGFLKEAEEAGGAVGMR